MLDRNVFLSFIKICGWKNSKECKLGLVEDVLLFEVEFLVVFNIEVEFV